MQHRMQTLYDFINTMVHGGTTLKVEGANVSRGTSREIYWKDGIQGNRSTLQGMITVAKTDTELASNGYKKMISLSLPDLRRITVLFWVTRSTGYI